MMNDERRTISNDNKIQKNSKNIIFFYVCSVQYSVFRDEKCLWITDSTLDKLKREMLIICDGDVCLRQLGSQSISETVTYTLKKVQNSSDCVGYSSCSLHAFIYFHMDVDMEIDNWYICISVLYFVRCTDTVFCICSSFKWLELSWLELEIKHVATDWYDFTYMQLYPIGRMPIG